MALKTAKVMMRKSEDLLFIFCHHPVLIENSGYGSKWERHHYREREGEVLITLSAHRITQPVNNYSPIYIHVHPDLRHEVTDTTPKYRFERSPSLLPNTTFLNMSSASAPIHTRLVRVK